jgi:hypothetical protein
LPGARKGRMHIWQLFVGSVIFRGNRDLIENIHKQKSA